MASNHHEPAHHRHIINANPTDAAIGRRSRNFVFLEIGKLGVAQLADINRPRLARR